MRCWPDQQYPDPVGSRGVGRRAIPMPALLATAAVHHHLIRRACASAPGWWWRPAKRAKCTISACWRDMARRRSTRIWRSRRWSRSGYSDELTLKPYEVQKNYIKAIGKGILKVMSKMGISTYQSYCGAQIFDAVGLSSDFVEKCFTGTASTIEGAGLARKSRAKRCSGMATRTAKIRCIDGDAGCGRRLCIPPARRGSCLDAGNRWPNCSMRRAAISLEDFRAFTRMINDQSDAVLDPARADGNAICRRAGAAGRGRAGGCHRAAVRDGGDEFRVDLA